VTSVGLAATGRALAPPGRIFLSADERSSTVARRLALVGLDPGPEARRAYREMLLAAPCLTHRVGAVVIPEDALCQAASDGTCFPDVLGKRGLVWGVRVDTALARLPESHGETVTEGLTGLRLRLAAAARLGARFARWRAVFDVGERRPSPLALTANAQAAARFAVLCQEQGLVPLVSARILRGGNHSLERSCAASEAVLRAIVVELVAQGADLCAVVLGTSMVLPGTAASLMATVDEVADATRRCLLRAVPGVVPAVVLSTTGQSATAAAAHLNALVSDGGLPWPLVLSSGPTLQDAVLRAWRGRPNGRTLAHEVLAHRLHCHQAAALGDWSPQLEECCAASG
jgi:fructose-bisphosphate aldolase, class I